MKSGIWTYFLFLSITLILMVVACNKADQTVSDKTDLTTADSTIDTSTSLPVKLCLNAPDYGDSIVYVKPQNGGDFFVEPTNNIGIEGTYLSWPEGLQINRNTGVINLSQSETGVRYQVAFVKKGTTDTCVSQLIVGGLTYMDGIYVLDQHDTLAKPVFNADPFKSSVCDVSDDTDYPDNNGNGNNQCAFDDDAPGQRANDHKLRVRTKSGIINMKKSVDDGLFGKNPKNGATKMVQIRYRLNDASQKALQKIAVQVMYYDKVSSIPLTLQQEIAGKRNSMFNYKIVKGKPRPPLLIIAGFSR
ncbi:hypothetical protein [Longitalea luteola]|uniref:hypothetical protein n=1 Tax=Longitalea luteola TaxID=2812563 RepID=UPI001A96B7BE|nr:hypothetical protein [Longitalea luteola]